MVVYVINFEIFLMTEKSRSPPLRYRMVEISLHIAHLAPLITGDQTRRLLLFPQALFVLFWCLLWPPYVIGQAIIFLPCGFFLSSIYLSFLFLA